MISLLKKRDYNMQKKKKKDYLITFYIIFIFSTSFLLSFNITKNIALSHEDARNLAVVKRLLHEGKLEQFSSYQGNNFFLIPFVLLFGYIPLTLRIADSFFLALSNLIMFLFLKRFYNKSLGLMSSFMMMFITFFITNTESEVPFLPFCSLFFLFLLSQFYTKKKILFLYLAMFFAGYATSLKITFLYFFIACFISGFLVFRKGNALKHIFNIKTVIYAIVSFLIGLSPFIYENLTNNFPFFQLLLSKLGSTSLGHSNFSLTQNLLVRVNHISDILSPGSWTFRLMPFSFNTILFFVSLFFIYFICNKKHRFIVYTIIVYIILSTFSPSNLLATHLILILPLLIVIMAQFIFKLYNSKKTGLKLVSIVILYLYFYFNLFGYISTYHLSRDQQFFELHYPKNAKVHQEVALYFKDKPSNVVLGVFNPSYFFNALLPFSFEKRILCRSHFPSGGWTYPYPSTKCENAIEVISNNLIRNDTTWVFSSMPRINRNSSRIYSDFCAISDIQKNPCYKPFYVFTEEISKRNLSLKLIHTIDDSKSQPVYDIYEVLA